MRAKHPTTGTPTPADVPTPPLREGLASTAQACEFLQVSRQFLWLRAREGQIKPIHFGRLTRYRWVELEAIAQHGFPIAAQAAQGSAK
jgi:hypothetical protein